MPLLKTNVRQIQGDLINIHFKGQKGVLFTQVTRVIWYNYSYGLGTGFSSDQQ